MIDRKARDEAAGAIEDFLADRISAFDFDSRLAITTEDETVNLIAEEAWFHYDDCRDHQVCFSKREWDLFERLRLILKSDVEIELIESPRRWTLWNGLAAALLISFLAVAYVSGWGLHLMLYSLLIGVVSILISKGSAQRTSANGDLWAAAHAPFSTFSEIRRIRSRVPGFSKARFRAEVEHRRIRGPVAQGLVNVNSHLLWLCFAPVVLFFQAIPDGGEATVRLR